MYEASTATAQHAYPHPPWLIEALGMVSGAGIRIAVVDSGWDRAVEDARVRPGIGFVDEDQRFVPVPSEDDRDRNGHGTACTDLILRMAPGVTIYPVRVFGKRLETDVSVLEAAIRWAIDERVHLINLSLGTLRNDVLRPLYVACEEALQRGVIVVSATHVGTSWSYPAVFANVLSVGMADRPFRDPFAYRFQPGEAVECIAGGRRQPVRLLGGTIAHRSGSSFAAPLITGLVALYKEQHPEAGIDEVRAFLYRHGPSGANVMLEKG